MTIFMVTHKQRLLLQEIRNVYYYETIVGDPTSAEWQDIADEIRGDYVAELQASLVTEWSFYSIEYRNVSAIGLPTFEVFPTAGTVLGLNNGDLEATQLALLVSHKVAATKPNRARNYYCGMAEGSLVDGLWVAGIRTSFEDFSVLQTVLNAAGTNDLQRVSAQWNSSHTQVIATNNIAAATLQASAVPATQRRRRIGVGI